MSAAKPPRLLAFVTAGERPVLEVAAQRMVECVSKATGTTWPVRLRFLTPDEAPPPGMAIIASMVGDVATSETDIEWVWHSRIARWRSAGDIRILLCTVFRHVDDAAVRPRAVERIRRLNLLAIALSRSEGVEIVDLDRLFALHGARTLGTDYRCTGADAATVAGVTIAGAVLGGDLDDHLDAATREQAYRIHGGGEATAR